MYGMGIIIVIIIVDGSLKVLIANHCYDDHLQ